MCENNDENLTEEKPARQYSEPIKRAICEGLRRAIPETPEAQASEPEQTETIND
jgi:hypothetical protein